MSLSILGIGTAVPPYRISQDEAVEAAKVMSSCTPDQAAVLSVLYRQTDIASRHMIHGRDVLQDVINRSDDTGTGFVPSSPDDPGPSTAERMHIYEREALPLALKASLGALEASGVDPADITHLVTVTCTGFTAPGFDIGLIKGLPLNPSVERTQVGFMGCHGAFNGLRVARAFVEADPSARVLVCATELCSPHYHYSWNPKRMVGNALFADGAAALVAGNGQFDDPGSWKAVANGSCLFSDSESAMSWNIGNHGFEMTLSTRVPSLIANNLRPWLERWLADHQLTIDKVASWAIHPGGPRILTSVEASLGLPLGTTNVAREILCEYGNMSSPTILFILDRLRQQEAPLPCVALGFGPGLCAEGMLFV